MGCTNSKEEPREAKVAESETNNQQDVSQSAPPAANPTAEAADADNAAIEKSRYKLAGPTVEGEVSDLWSPHAYKVVNEEGWYVYSDTNKYEVTFTFTTTSELEAGDVETSKDGDKNVFTISLFPGETKCLWKGQPNGWGYKASAKGLSEEYLKKQAEGQSAAVSADIERFEAISQAAGGDAEAALSELILGGDEEAKYVDMAFKPVAESLGAGMRPAAWMRPSQFLPEAERSRAALITDGVEPNDIDQGQLGDCWFLCSIASVAEDPEKIKDMFAHPKNDEAALKAEQAKGAYRVTINKHGWWHNLVVDDYLPCVSSTPCFAKNVEDPAELWVALLEKAYARLHGSYKAIAAGDARQGLQDLTGYPTERFPDFNENPEELFERILAYDKAGYMINVNTPGQDDSAYMGKSGAGNSEEFSERYKKAGLGMGHAYSVLVAKEFPDHGLQLLQIRNPWGNGTEWTGDWSDDSELWDKYPDVKKECNPQTEGDGTFWMSWTDARAYFDSGGVCYCERDWYDYRVKARFEEARPNVVLEITVKEETDIYITVSQKDRRGLSDSDPERNYHSVMISVCEFDEEKGKYNPSRNSNWKRLEQPQPGYGFCGARDLSMKVTLKPSEKPYLVVPRAHSSCKAAKDFVIGLISSKPVSDSTMDVKFVQPKEDWGCFKNYTRFPYAAGDFPALSTEFQFNPEVGCPMTFTSDALFTQNEL